MAISDHGLIFPSEFSVAFFLPTPDLGKACGLLGGGGGVVFRITTCFVQVSSEKVPTCQVQQILLIPTGTGWTSQKWVPLPQAGAILCVWKLGGAAGHNP